MEKTSNLEIESWQEIEKDEFLELFKHVCKLHDGIQESEHIFDKIIINENDLNRYVFNTKFLGFNTYNPDILLIEHRLDKYKKDYHQEYKLFKDSKFYKDSNYIAQVCYDKLNGMKSISGIIEINH